MKKRIMVIICIWALLSFAVDSGISMLFQQNYNPMQRLVSIEENEQSISDIRISRNIFTGHLYLNVHSYYGKTAYTKLVDEDGSPIFWRPWGFYEDRFDLVFALYSDDSGDVYQVVVDKLTHVMYRFYLTGDYSVHLETAEDGTPLQWEGEVPSYENLLA